MYGGWVWGDEQESKPEKAEFDIEKYKGRVFAIPDSSIKWQVKTVHPYMHAITIVNVMDKTDTKEFTVKFFMENATEVWW